MRRNGTGRALVLLLLIGTPFWAACGSKAGNELQRVTYHSFPEDAPTAEVIARSTAVVEGGVRHRIKSQFNRAHTYITTDWLFGVSHWLKGDGPAAIVIRTVGGTAEGVMAIDPDAVRLKVGVPIVLCLTLEQGTVFDYSGQYYVTLGRIGAYEQVGATLESQFARHRSISRTQFDELLEADVRRRASRRL